MAGSMVKDIVGKLKAERGGMTPPAAPTTEPEESEEDMGLSSAAEEMISAMKAGDVSGLVTALKSFVSMCKGSSYSDEE